jgi:HD-like signal output (HDOD) protein
MEQALDPAVQGEAGALHGRIRETLAGLSKTGGLPTIPPVVSSALAAIRDPDVEVGEVCRIVRTDVGIAARVLGVSNSVVYARRRVHRTLEEAMIAVGLATVQEVLLTASLRSLYDASKPVVSGLWDHALATGIACQELAAVLDYGNRAGAFLPGLFHDVGRLAFFTCDPAAYEVIARVLAGSGGDRRALEREWFGFDHAEAAAALAADWSLTAEACSAIRWHHEPEHAGIGRALARLVTVADQLVQTIGLGGFPAAPLSPGILDAHLSPEDQASFGARIRAAFEEQRKLFQ